MWVGWVRDRNQRWQSFAARDTWTEALELSLSWVVDNFGCRRPAGVTVVALWWAWGDPTGPCNIDDKEISTVFEGGAPDPWDDAKAGG